MQILIKNEEDVVNAIKLIVNASQHNDEEIFYMMLSVDDYHSQIHWGEKNPPEIEVKSLYVRHDDDIEEFEFSWDIADENLICEYSKRIIHIAEGLEVEVFTSNY